MTSIGKTLMFLGLGLVLLGALIWLGSKLGLGFGKLPGDINIQKEKVSFYFPITTSITISIILTVLLNLIFWIKNKF